MYLLWEIVCQPTQSWVKYHQRKYNQRENASTTYELALRDMHEHNNNNFYSDSKHVFNFLRTIPLCVCLWNTITRQAVLPLTVVLTS